VATPASSHEPTSSRAAPRLRDLVRLFFWLGLTAFGGPAAHVALMEDAVVRQRQWLTRERFLRMLGVTNLLPGPNSTEMAMHIGQAHAGGAGLVLSGLAFILPAALMSAALAWVYARYGLTPPVEGLLYGLKPVVVAVVAQALWRLGRAALRTPALIAVGLLAVLASLAGLHELIVLLTAGVAHLALARPRRDAPDRGRGPDVDSAGSDAPHGGAGASPRAGAMGLALAARVMPSGAVHVGATAGPGAVAGPAVEAGARTAAAAAAGAGAGAGVAVGLAGASGAAPTLATIFLVFLKIGSVLFGSGYVLIMFLRADVVQRYHWLTESQLVDAIAVGQIVPGPVTTTVTFIGYLIGGPWGAFVATVAVFLPAFCFVGLSSRFVPLVERSPRLQALLDGVVAGSLALMAIVTFELGRAALIDPLTAGVALVTLLALVRYRANPGWCVAGAALLGLLVRLGLR
jgi:chromate transporter